MQLPTRREEHRQIDAGVPVDLGGEILAVHPVQRPHGVVRIGQRFDETPLLPIVANVETVLPGPRTDADRSLEPQIGTTCVAEDRVDRRLLVGGERDPGDWSDGERILELIERLVCRERKRRRPRDARAE